MRISPGRESVAFRKPMDNNGFKITTFGSERVHNPLRVTPDFYLTAKLGESVWNNFTADLSKGIE